MSSTLTLVNRSERRLRLLLRTLGPQGVARCPSSLLRHTVQGSSFVGKFMSSDSKRTVSIGGVTKDILPSKNPELIPIKYLPNDGEIPKETLKQLKWMMQKDLLGQDIFLIGRPSPLRRQLALQYLELTGREVEFVALSRDTTESDLKQRREIAGGTSSYIDQSAVKAASQGRVLVLEGIEKAERNVLPVLNNLLENREMHLEDGRLLIPASRYDKLLQEHSQEELDNWKLVRVSENFRVIALGLPVPQYVGNPLDPPLRSRFQCRDIRHLPFKEQLLLLQGLGQRLPSEVVSQMLSFAHTMVSDESSNLGLPDFPVENLPALTAMLNEAPNLSLLHALERLYPFKVFLPEDGQRSVEDTLRTFHIDQGSKTNLLSIESINSSTDNQETANVEVKIDNRVEALSVPCGLNRAGVSTKNFVPTAYHDWFIADLLISHSVKDFCVIGPKGSGKSIVIERLADVLGYETEPIMLYQDMTARDLLQQRTTLPNGDTVWRHSPLVTAALEGKMAVLDGVHRIHKGTLAVLHRLVHDRELQLYDGTRLLRHDRYEAVKERENLTDIDMAERGVLPIKPNFRIVALAEPPIIGGSSKEQWMTAEILSMFLFHTLRPLSQKEEMHVLKSLTGEPNKALKDILALTHNLRASHDSSLKSIANSLSTRQLIRISKRLHKFGSESAYNAVQKACLGRFLPSLPKETLEKMMADLKIAKPKKVKESDQTIVCKVENGILTLGETSAPVLPPDTKTKIPETLFYDTVQNVASMEAMMQDFLLGEHLLLVGNQGVGKNKLVDRLLNLLNRPREYIQLHRDTTVQSLTLSPTVRDGVIVYEDSPLVKAVKAGHILVVDEADKAPTHVTCILKTLVESGEMILSDGRRIMSSTCEKVHSHPEIYIRAHPDFRMIVLANRPGFPFLGNDFFGALGDLFSCHAIDNPSIDSELSMLRQYGPNVSEDVLRRLVKAFSELRSLADEGQGRFLWAIQYPYSTREVVNIVRHLERFPNEGLGSVVRNVFDFDSYDKETRETLDEVLHKHGIPIGTSSRNIGLAREFPLPNRISLGTWKIYSKPRGSITKPLTIPVSTKPIGFSSPQKLTRYEGGLDRIEARGVGFSEMQSFWSLPFHDYAIVGDICVEKDAHNRQLFDKIHVCTSNPVWLYTMKPLDDNFQRLSINHLFDSPGSYQSSLPRIKISTLGGKASSVVAVHDEGTNRLALVDTEANSSLRVETDKLSGFSDSMTNLRQRFVNNDNSKSSRGSYYRMHEKFANDNQLLFYTVNGNSIFKLDFRSDQPTITSAEIPMTIQVLHPLNENQFLIVTNSSDNEHERLLLLKKDLPEDPLPTVLSPITQTSDIGDISGVCSQGLSDFGLRMTLGDKLSSPNTLMNSPRYHALLVVGFPELEYSENEVFAWPKSEEVIRAAEQVTPSNSPYTMKRFFNSGRNTVFLPKSCQIVRPVSPQSIPSDYLKQNTGLYSPGTIGNYLEVVDLMSSRLRYIPVPEAPHTSSFTSWYKQTYPDQSLGLCEMSNEGLVSVDNSGTVRLWETGVANLERSLNEWRQLIGDRESQLTLERDQVGELGTPKHGKEDPDNAPHVGGNTWAGGTGGRDTAGLGGIGGPYRLDAGHNVHQVSDEIKAQVPEHIRKAAREMNRKAYEEKLREIKMSQYDADLYERYSSHIRKQVQALKTIINSLQAKAKDRQWLKNQTSGELDDTRLIEGITGEKSIYKKRGEQEPEAGSPQEKPKRFRLLVDVSGSMYRFNGHDQRLERMMESALLVMEALEGYSDKIKYDIIGHSGEDKAIPFCVAGEEPKNEKQRLDILRMMLAHAQFCMSGDHTLQATVTAISELGKMADDHDESFVIVLSDANFDRYGISPKAFGKILNKTDQVSAFAIFIGSLGDQAERLTKSLPSGKAFVCLDTKKIPEILKTIFTSTMLK